MRKCKVICWFFCSQGFHTSWCWISCRFQWFGRWFCYWYCGRCWCKRAGTTTPSVCRYDFDSYLCWSTWSVRAYCCHLPVHKINAKQKLWNLSYILYTTIFLLELFFFMRTDFSYFLLLFPLYNFRVIQNPCYY